MSLETDFMGSSPDTFTVRCWASYMISLCPGFLINKWGNTSEPISQGGENLTC